MNKKRICKISLSLLLVCVMAGMSVLAEQAEAMGRTKVTIEKRNKKSVVLKVKKLSGVTGYQIFLASSKNGKYRQIGATRTSSFQITKLKKNKSYYVKARAYKTTGYRISTGKYSSKVKIKKYSSKPVSGKYAEEVISSVNKEREKNNLSALVENKALTEAAMIRAKELAEQFSHVRPGEEKRDGLTVLTDLEIVYSSAGENICEGAQTSKEVMQLWMSSDGHKANILSDTYSDIGVGYYEKGGRHYWVQLFIKK